MPCGTDRLGCYGCAKHDLKSMYKCITCTEWFCSTCIFQSLPDNVCVDCLAKEVRVGV